jgi:hypothetical protein
MKSPTLWLAALGFGFVTLTGAPTAAQAQVDEKNAPSIFDGTWKPPAVKTVAN